MEYSDFYEELMKRFKKIVEENNLLDETIKITGRTLNVEEAIGNPNRKDYPILKGKEKLMEAEFKGEKGQAFTDMSMSFSGTLKNIINKEIENNFDRAVLISTVNAVCRFVGITDRTIHCKNEEPEKCAREMVEFIEKNNGSPKIALIGLQPAMLERLSEKFDVRTVDLDKDNIGKEKFGVLIEDGYTKAEEVINWCDLIVATGSTCANGSIVNFLEKKPVIFFGTTIAGTAALMGLKRFCACSK